MESIFSINDYIYSLNEKERKIILGLYEIDTFEANMHIPESFEEKILKYISGNKEAGIDKNEILNRVRNQKILGIANKWTYESALYNYLRACRPGVNIKDDDKLENWLKSTIEDSSKKCDFCSPEKYTPEDSFGRIYGRYCVTAANLAKFDKFHSLLVFNKHNPLDFTEEEFIDYIDTAFRWFSKVKSISKEYRYSLLLWNCLPRAGASQVHGHMQMLMAKKIYPKMKQIIDAATNYKDDYGIDYFDALCQVHEILGLLIRKDDIKILGYITPIKEHELFIISGTVNDTFKTLVYKILRRFISRLNILSFNFSLYEIPDTNNGYKYILRIVDRGNVLSKTSDIASMELYASSVIAHDPIQLISSIMDI